MIKIKCEIKPQEKKKKMFLKASPQLMVLFGGQILFEFALGSNWLEKL
jgi:hypothetical protein